METDCLFRYNEPVSPHLAALRHGGDQVCYIFICFLGRIQRIVQVSDGAFVDAIKARVSSYAQDASGAGHVYIETAGGS